MPSVHCYGYELCEEGVFVARTAAAKFGLDVNYRQLDYLRISDASELFELSDVSFTCFSLEQVPVNVHNALTNILALSIRGSVHLEPVPENYPFTWRGIIGRIDHRKVNYVRNLDAAMKSCGAHIAERTILRTAHNPLMFPTLYVLRKP